MTRADLLLLQSQHEQLRTHLFPGDGQEAAALLFCRSALPLRDALMVVDIELVPHEACAVRTPTRLTWPGEALLEASDRAERETLSLVLLHSHPGGLLDFSAVDDESDRQVIPTLFHGWTAEAPPAGHGSAVMVPDGRMAARRYDASGAVTAISHIAVIGHDIRYVHADAPPPPAMAFGSGMTAALAPRHACVVGVSGTGSIVAEQAARMGVGRITLIDFDHVEAKNLNRILNSTLEDAAARRLKTEMFAEAIRRHHPDTEVVVVSDTLVSRAGIAAAATADILFSCVDSAEGRYIADAIGQAFYIPVIDVGVTIPTRLQDGERVAIGVYGRIDYVRPGGATLGDREVYTPAALASEYLQRTAPETWVERRKEGYIKDAPEEAPSVIALNMRAASAAMLEYVARLCLFRHAPSSGFARTLFDLAEGDEDHYGEETFDRSGLLVPGAGVQSFPLINPLQASGDRS